MYLPSHFPDSEQWPPLKKWHLQVVGVGVGGWGGSVQKKAGGVIKVWKAKYLKLFPWEKNKYIIRKK